MGHTVEQFAKGAVRGFVHAPENNSRGDGLVLTHGAGANCASSLLIAAANAFCAAGLWVLRFDLPFRQRRAFGPPHRNAAAEDRAGIEAALDCMRSIASGRVFAGGHSYGGRQTSMLAAENAAYCDALLLLSYPLHPPKKPDQTRTAHFATLRTPSLFVHGTADPFGSPEEMVAAIELISGRKELVFIDGAGHDLKHGKFELTALVVERFAKLAR